MEREPGTFRYETRFCHELFWMLQQCDLTAHNRNKLPVVMFSSPHHQLSCEASQEMRDAYKICLENMMERDWSWGQGIAWKVEGCILQSFSLVEIWSRCFRVEFLVVKLNVQTVNSHYSLQNNHKVIPVTWHLLECSGFLLSERHLHILSSLALSEICFPLWWFLVWGT